MNGGLQLLMGATAEVVALFGILVTALDHRSDLGVSLLLMALVIAIVGTYGSHR